MNHTFHKNIYTAIKTHKITPRKRSLSFHDIVVEAEDMLAEAMDDDEKKHGL